MLYLNEADIRALPYQWSTLIAEMERAVRVMEAGDYAQPIKPYLRYGDPANRMIAMPAYLGGSFAAAGLKWIASFPSNRNEGLPRAHSVTLLNDHRTGRPVAMLNATLPSMLRTAAVSGLLLTHYVQSRRWSTMKVGILGFGPIGRQHVDMCNSQFGSMISSYTIYDPSGVDLSGIAEPARSRAQVADSWEEVVMQSDVLITCTVSDKRYISSLPRPGSLLLHVSLRDYVPEAIAQVKQMIVDDWEEVCREQTDIERLHLGYGLMPEQVFTLQDVVCRHVLDQMDPEESVLFSPMGMGIFDVAIASRLLLLAREHQAGTALP
ncbi:2,3-diaminopropionate biosynthesis protein SbnB [Marinicrinis sediminis]|uniref:2,3-diaminopropionate biosynthesis protein SbnB n=1 Tax=Marinicrinis sediminis TaxID=1652465 RepID=A0ABW5R9J1_9BACL